MLTLSEAGRSFVREPLFMKLQSQHFKGEGMFYKNFDDLVEISDLDLWKSSAETFIIYAHSLALYHF